MRLVDDIIINETDSISQLLEAINKGSMQIALVVNNDGVLKGTVTDGDIRRGLLSGISLDDTVATVMSDAPFKCNINDSREKILQTALSNSIHQIPIVNDNGVVVGIEEINDLVKPPEYKNKVVIMAGGLGTRLRPLTEKTPKPLLVVGNKPILETIINNFSKQGFKNIILSVNYKAEMIEKYFDNGEKFGVNIEYVYEDTRLGTAGSLSKMIDILKEPFFVINGDILTNVNVSHLLDYHISNKAMATMTVREYDMQVPYGVVQIDDNKVITIEEKPVQSFFVNAGIYVLNSMALSYLPENEFFDMPTLFEKILQDKQKIIPFPLKEYWLDIGRMSDFERANEEFFNIFE